MSGGGPTRLFSMRMRRQLLMWRSLDETSHAHYDKLMTSAEQRRAGAPECNPP